MLSTASVAKNGSLEKRQYVAWMGIAMIARRKGNSIFRTDNAG
jgi:hypothetical protein